MLCAICGRPAPGGQCQGCGYTGDLCNCARQEAEIIRIHAVTLPPERDPQTVHAVVRYLDDEPHDLDAQPVVDDVAPEHLVIPAPSNPIAVAREYVDKRASTPEGFALVRHHRNTFHAYDGTSWPETEDRALQADLYRWLAPAWYWKKTAKTMELVEFEPSRRKMGDLLEALAALVHVDGHLTPPLWLDEPLAQADEIVPMANGLLHLPTRRLMAHTPSYFSPHVLPFDYDPDAPVPTRWLQFMKELWPEDEDSPAALAEMVGYIIGGGTGLQKIAMLVGPKRSGKGTVGRVLTGLLGAHNVAAPTLSSLTTNFGLSPLIGRPLALISDARLGGRTDGSIAVERLLSISGEDAITIDRKYRDPWTGRLPTRFMILTNEIPRFVDASGALASRFILLVMTESFLNREDPGLTDTLLSEAPGIFNWALEGLDRLRDRGHFDQPASAKEALVRLEDLSSPVGAFVRDRCLIGPAYETGKDQLFEAWKDWCVAEGRDRAGSKAVFFRDLVAAYPGIRQRRLREGDRRLHVYQGVGLQVPGLEER